MQLPLELIRQLVLTIYNSCLPHFKGTLPVHRLYIGVLLIELEQQENINLNMQKTCYFLNLIYSFLYLSLIFTIVKILYTWIKKMDKKLNK